MYTPKYQVLESFENTLRQVIGPSAAKNEFDKENRIGANVVETGYFFIEPSYIISSGRIPILGDEVPDSLVDDMYRGVMWQVFLTNYTEGHNEGYYATPSFADVMSCYTTGSYQVSINMTGFIACNPLYNAKLDFISFYNTLLRGSRQKIHKIPIGFSLRNTFMKLLLVDLQITTSVEMPDFASVVMNGTGYNYITFQSK